MFMFCGTHCKAIVNIYIYYSYWIAWCIELQNSEVCTSHQREHVHLTRVTFIYFTNWRYKIISLYYIHAYSAVSRISRSVCLYMVQSTELGTRTAAAFSNHFFRSVVICKPRWEDAQWRSSVTGVCSSIK